MRYRKKVSAISKLLKKLGEGRTSDKFRLPYVLSSIAGNVKFNRLLDIYCKCFIFDVYKSLEKLEKVSWYRAASLFEVGTGEQACVLIATLKRALMKLIKGRKIEYLLNSRAVIQLKEIISHLGDGNSKCDNCSLQGYLRSYNTEFAVKLSERYKKRGKCEACKTHVNRETLTSPSTFFEDSPILLAKGGDVQLAGALASMKEEDDSEVIAQLILLHHGDTVEVAINCELKKYALYYGTASLYAGEIDVLTLKENKITQIEITRIPYVKDRVGEWCRHQLKAYHRHFILKSLNGFSVKTFFLFPHIGEKVKITPKSQVRREFTFCPIPISFDFNKDVEKAKEKMKELIKAI